MLVTVDVKDEFINEFMAMVESLKDKVTIKKDKNLELDPFFYERREKLQKIREDIASGKMETYDFEEFEKNIEEFEKELELKYAN